MKVAIIGKKNGVGLEKDVQILSGLLKDNNIEVIFKNTKKIQSPDPDVDVCIFTEIVNPNYLGKINILIPNQEWFYKAWIPELSSFDGIFCKSKYAADIFKTYHPNVIYTGFTSIDHYREIEKAPICFHSQGKSFAKGTQFVLQAWENPGLPLLHLVTRMKNKQRDNVKAYTKRLPEEEYITLMNQCLIHILPSQVEGFGHCINEARSCGAIIVTSNFPPMNELVSKYLLPVQQIFLLPDRLGHCITINPLSIEKVLNKITTQKDLTAIGMNNRQAFLKNDNNFRQRFMHALMKL